ncbi:DUF2273 domain-containing protein [Streptococcus ferus]|uniref:Membrane protein n=1 Tax=Streptococcus ferus TaxID=1345 RepID=A0A2X3VCQ9_9STRE|nr:DUF2273 domain-containing protein [Streptococcus ferus]SQF39184.1 membrane protein [Streptococcus ferus]
MTLFKRYKFPLLGGAVGLLLGLLLLTVGFFKTIFAIICIILGVYSARWIEKSGLLNQWIK